MKGSPKPRREVNTSENLRTWIDYVSKYIDTIGGHPEKRGEWFQNDGDIDTMRQKMRDVCPFSEDLMLKLKSGERKGVQNVNRVFENKEDNNKLYKLVIYQRDQNRRVGNEAEILSRLQSDPSRRLHVST